MTNPDDGKYTSEHLQDAFRLVDALFGHEVSGLTPKDIAEHTQLAPSKVTRLVDNLRTAGWVETVPETGRVRLGPKVVQGAVRFATGIDQAQRRLTDLRNRFTRDTEPR